MDVDTRSIPPVMEPDGGPLPDTHIAVLDPQTNRPAWVVRRWADAWVKRRLDAKLDAERKQRAKAPRRGA